MDIKHLLINLGKLLLCSITFSLGMIVGGMLMAFLNWQPPATPAGMDMNTALRNILLTSPILALALALLARGIGGTFLTRMFALSFLTWIAYTVNTVVEFAVPSLFCGALVAFLFPSDGKAEDLRTIVYEFFSRRTPLEWIWRLCVACCS